MTILKLRGINQSEDPLRQWQLLCELDGVLINRLMMTMQKLAAGTQTCTGEYYRLQPFTRWASDQRISHAD